MLTIWLGPAGSGKTRAVCEALRSRLAGGRDLVLLTPEQQSHRAERQLAAVCGPRLSLGAEVLSFTRMYDRVAAELGGLSDPVPDRGGRLLLLALALDAVAPKLSRYGAKRRRSDFLSELLAAAEECEAAMLGPDALLEASERLGGSMGEKLHDLALLLGSYQAVLGRQLGDSRDRIRRLADRVFESTVGRGGIWVDGFTDFTACELRVLDELLRRGADLTVTLTLGEGEESCFRLTEGSFRELCALAQKRGAELCIRRLPAHDTPLRRLAEGLFAPPAEPATEVGGAAVELCRMSSFSGECRWAASRILALLREDPTLRYGDFAVCAADFAAGRTELETVLEEYGLPFFDGETSSLADKGLAAFVLAALQVCTGGWEPRHVFACLRTGFAGLGVEETDRLENYCLVWRIRGPQRWLQEADWDDPPGGFAAELTEADRAELEAVNALRRRFALPLGRLGRALAGEPTAGDAVRALYAYLEEVGLRESLSARARRLDGLGRRAEAEECLRLWDALMDCLSQLDAVLGGVTLEGGELLRLLELLLREKRMGAIPAAIDCVTVGGLARLRGLQPRVLVILGADDASLPGTDAAGGLFSAEERQSLRESGLPLGREREEEAARPLLALYEAVCTPSERLLVSYSGGEERRPSLLITRAQALLGVPLQTEETLQGRQLGAARGPMLRLALGGGSPWATAAAHCLDAAELEDVRRAAAQPRDDLRPETVRALYGKSFRLTASRAETFHSCRYRYFLEYGLRARERRQAEFQAPELGAFVHFVLEGVCREVAMLGGFADVSAETLRVLTEKYTEDYTRRYLSPARLADPRFAYLFRRLCISAAAIVRDVAAELAASDFRPLDFELRFASGEAMPPAEVGDVSVSGMVDRVDGWVKDDTLYLCVADYKTGRRAFDLSDVRCGLGIQMLIYLFVLAEKGEAYYGQPVAPAGVLYAPAREVLLSMPRSSSDAEIARKRADTLRRSGLLLADPALLQAREHGTSPRYLPVKYVRDGTPTGSLASAARLGALAAYVRRLLEKMGGALRCGSVAADPLWESAASGPCEWCPYGDACAFDETRDRARLRRSVTDEEFWRELEEVQKDGV